MNDIGNFFIGLSSLIWPVIILFVVLKFSGPIKDIISTARTRGFTLKLGGSELSFAEAAQQQLVQINDLQEQIVRLSRDVDELKGGLRISEESAPYSTNKIKRILWVDDYPSNNASIVAHLMSLGVSIETALSTQEGLRRFHDEHYDLILSDMGRKEDGVENPDAGIDLTKAIREYDAAVPVLIYCSKRALLRFEQEALDAGVNAITNSAVRLLSEISRIGRLGQ